MEGQEGRGALLAIAVAAVLSLFCAPAAQAEFGFITKWGLLGYPAEDVAIDPADNVYVAEATRVQKFTTDGTLITEWGSQGTGDGLFHGARDIATDPAGNVYVGDVFNNRIQKFTSDGTFITKWGSKGRGDGQFDYVTGVATDSFGNVYVADGDNNRIQKFASDGTFITKWGSKGRGDGQLDFPEDVATDSFGNVYVADLGNLRIQKFTSDGTFITKWRSHEPRAVATDAAGSVYVAESPAVRARPSRIQKFTSDGAFVFGWGCSGVDDGHLKAPHGIAIDAAGNVYVADTANGRIQKFGDPGSRTRPCVALEAERRQKVKELAVEIACTDQPCDVAVHGRATARYPGRPVKTRQRFQLKSVDTSLARGEAKTLRVRFRRQDARTLTGLLEQGAKAKVKIRAEARTVGVRTSTKKLVRFMLKV